MFGLARWSPFDEVFNFQREVDRWFNQFWNELPGRTPIGPGTSFQVQSGDEGWQVDVPMPGIDPKYITLEVAGNTLTVKAEVPGAGSAQPTRVEQSITVPQFLDLEKLSASYQFGMLRLTLPLKESVKPRRVQIQVQHEEQKQLAGVA